jgi:hypothetical protein
VIFTANGFGTCRITEKLDHAVIREKIVSLMKAEEEANARIADRFAQLLHETEEEAMALSRIETVSNAVFSAVQAQPL